ncbi:hypothetical protein PQX77_010674 [Marasmius sp. AFHP31]|nr:hypothetical protein PQX77_010674 [Marasmius sp. AFHP31]
MSTTQYTLPLTLRDWPWSRQINPFYQVCKEESAHWIGSLNAFSLKSQKAFDRCDFSLLASLSTPLLNKDGNRVSCDYMHLIFLVDEHTDVVSSEEAKRYCDIVKDALNNPHTPRPAGEWIGGEVARQFWENSIKTTTPSFQRHFVKRFGEYLDGMVEEVIERNDSRTPDRIESYLEIRRKSSGVLPCFSTLGMHMNLPDAIFDDPVISRLETLGTDLVLLTNDIYSYNVEQARGDIPHNVVHVYMNAYKTDIQEAMGLAASLHDRLAQEFLDLVGKVPKFGDATIDSDVSTYVDGLGSWIRGNDCWSFESPRYFGSQGVKIQETRMVELLPKVKSSAANQTDGTIGTFLIGGVQGITSLLYNLVFGSKHPVVPHAYDSPAATEIVI